MTSSSLNLSDAILIQRLDTSSAKPEMYATTLEYFSEFVTLNNEQIIADLSQQVEENTAELLAFKDTLAVVIKDLGVAKLDIYHNRTDIDQIINRLDKQEDKVRLFDTRAKVHLFYKWIEEDEVNFDPRSLLPGEMWADGDGQISNIKNLWYSTTDDDGTPVGQPYVYQGETLELTSMYHPAPNRPSKLRHRSVHLINEDPFVAQDFIRFKVTTLHAFSDTDEPPYYQEDDPQAAMTRSDFYPMAANLDDYKDHVEATYLPLSGSKTMHGDLKIQRSSPSIQLQIPDTSKAKINSTGNLQITYKNDRRIELTEEEVVISTNLDVEGNEILNVGVPHERTSAANKAYVDDAISGIDLEELEVENVFFPGNQVAKIGSSSGVEEGGFYTIGGVLYVKMP